MYCSPLALALVQLARKRQVIDQAQCARLQILLAAEGVETVESARRFLAVGGLLPPPVARKLLSHLPKPEQAHFGPYRPMAHLADGGMGSAWLAADVEDQLVVVKTMRSNLAGHAEVRHRFEREVRIMMELDHPNVVRCLDSGAADDGSLFMVLEFVDGGDLKELIDIQGALPEGLGLAIVCQVADALTMAEERHLVHRDIKPANIFAEADGRAKLADFGIARSTNTERTQLTMQGAVVGSPYYMAPEQVMAEEEAIGTPSDCYALGTVLYTCLAGTEPYRGALQDVLHAHCTAPVPDIREVRPQVGHSTASIITRCMQKEPADRYPNAAALRRDLLAALVDLERHDPLQAIAREHYRTPYGGETVVANTQDLDTQTALQQTEQGTLAATLAATAEDATMAMDLSSDPDATAAADLHLDPEATVAAELGRGVDPDATLAADLGAGQGATALMPATATAASQSLQGDLATAHDRAWLNLQGEGGQRVVLVAKHLLVLGKLCEPPVDICLRRYPIQEHRDACLKVSRQHCRLHYSGSSGIQLTDLGSGNGTVVDGQRLEANHPVALTNQHRLRIADAIDLRCRVLTKTGTETWSLDGAPASGGGFGCGIEVSHFLDGVTITRCDNRPEMAYAMVLRRLTIGGPHADLPLPGCDDQPFEIGLYDGRWIWRPDGHHPWQPLTPDQPFAAAGTRWRPERGDFRVFQ